MAQDMRTEPVNDEQHRLNEHFGKHADRNTHEKESEAQPGIRALHGPRRRMPFLAMTAGALAAGYLLGRNWPVVAVAIGAAAAKPAVKGVTEKAALMAAEAGKSSKKLAGKAAEVAGERSAIIAEKAAHVAGEAGTSGKMLAGKAAVVAGERGAIIAEKALEAGKQVLATTSEIAGHGLETGAVAAGKAALTGAAIVSTAGREIAKTAGRVRRERRPSRSQKARFAFWAAKRGAKMGARKARKSVSRRVAALS